MGVDKLNSKMVSVFWRVGEQLVKRRNNMDVLTVCEYPKSGGTWIAKMIASSLSLPYVGSGFFLPLIPCVIRTHWNPSPKFTPCVYVVRDPRDVIVSLFFHRVRYIERTPKRREEYLASFGEEISEHKIQQQLHRFIEIEFDNPRYGAHQNWNEFAGEILEIKENDETNKVQIVRYEDFVSDPVNELAALLGKLGYGYDVDRLETIERLFNKSSEKKHQTSSLSKDASFVRNGVPGDWKNHFSSESEEALNSRCGEYMSKLGY